MRIHGDPSMVTKTKRRRKKTRLVKIPLKPLTYRPLEKVYQFKITLIGIQPPIWRRIQVKECTLDKLHTYIQTAMGWSNSHLHHFKFDEQLFGNPLLMGGNFREKRYRDSTRTKLSDIMPHAHRKLRFIYEYDFGDSWAHEVIFEERPYIMRNRKYPICLEGARACPPEDIGGVWGYDELIAALRNKRSKRHKEVLNWLGPYNAEEFDPEEASNTMRKGLPEWKVLI